MTHVGSAGRPLFLCSRSLFFSSSPFLLLLSYFLLYGWAKPLLIVLLSKIMGGGCDDCDAMILAAAQAIFWPTQFFFNVCCVDAFYLRKPGKIPYVLVFNLHVPEGRC